MDIIVPGLAVNVFKVLFIQNVTTNAEEIYLVVMSVNKNVRLNASVKKIVQIYAHMDIAPKNVAKFVWIVQKNANLNVPILNARNYAVNYAIENRVIKDVKK